MSEIICLSLLHVIILLYYLSVFKFYLKTVRTQTCVVIKLDWFASVLALFKGFKVIVVATAALVDELGAGSGLSVVVVSRFCIVTGTDADI